MNVSPDMPYLAHVRKIWRYGALVFGLGLMLPIHGALAQGSPLIHFAIPAQPLASALEAYSNATGLELFYDGELVISRRSSGVEGAYSPDEAIRRLLLGTDLTAKITAPSSLTIRRIGGARVASAIDQSYFDVIQARVARALCADANTRPGETDLLFQIWIAASGAVERVHVIEPANNTGREGAFAKALRGLTIGRSPPTGMPQPITMAILAYANGETSGCAGSGMTATRQ